MENKSHETYTYYQRFRITCETVVDLADSKVVYIFLFSVLLFAIFPATWMYLLNELSIAHMVFKNNLFLANAFQIAGTQNVLKNKNEIKKSSPQQTSSPQSLQKAANFFPSSSPAKFSQGH